LLLQLLLQRQSEEVQGQEELLCSLLLRSFLLCSGSGLLPGSGSLLCPGSLCLPELRSRRSGCRCCCRSGRSPRSRCCPGSRSVIELEFDSSGTVNVLNS